jgi:dihydropteroate synthase
MPLWLAHGRLLADDSRPRIMGILNVTPDSFSDGGQWASFDSALAHAEAMAAEGADLIDLGGESSRPAAEPVPENEEIRRVIPVLEALRDCLTVPVSIDTAKPSVARLAIASGASVINDIGGLRDPEMVRVIADTDAAVVIMHMAGTPQTMHINPHYDDVVLEVRDALARALDKAESAGIARHRVALDPGIGFGKTTRHNLDLLRNLPAFASLGCTLLVGLSRKGFLGEITGRPRNQRVSASVVGSLASAVNGARVLRVHDVGPMADALKVWNAIKNWNIPS